MILNFRNRETGKPNQPDVLKSVINKLLPEEINPKIHHFLREQSEKKKHEDGEILIEDEEDDEYIIKFRK